MRLICLHQVKSSVVVIWRWKISCLLSRYVTQSVQLDAWAAPPYELGGGRVMHPHLFQISEFLLYCPPPTFQYIDPPRFKFAALPLVRCPPFLRLWWFWVDINLYIKLTTFTLSPCTVRSETILGDDSDQLSSPILSVLCDGDIVVFLAHLS